MKSFRGSKGVMFKRNVWPLWNDMHSKALYEVVTGKGGCIWVAWKTSFKVLLPSFGFRSESGGQLQLSVLVGPGGAAQKESVPRWWDNFCWSFSESLWGGLEAESVLGDAGIQHPLIYPKGRQVFPAPAWRGRKQQAWQLYTISSVREILNA